ncbi:MAG: hypothetical protein K0S41_963 [Anaerocolumna sp.]|nr:hypothetical protein [Anaerocolumna sp.]
MKLTIMKHKSFTLGDIMGQLILVEGIPGSGKTTTSEKIYNKLSIQKKTNLYMEGDGHPADLAWCACIPLNQLDEIINNNKTYELRIREHMYIEQDYAIVPYTKIPIENPEFYHLMENFEVYNNRVGFDIFKELHVGKWNRFGEKQKNLNEVTIFECAFLQNHINELLLYHCMDERQIEKYLLELIHTVKDLNPILIYLNQKSVVETIERVSNVRVDEIGDKVWMKMVIDYVENSPYGKKHTLKGFEGMVKYFEDRKQIELNIMNKLPIKVYIVDNKEYDWEKVWTQVQSILDNII